MTSQIRKSQPPTADDEPAPMRLQANPTDSKLEPTKIPELADYVYSQFEKTAIRDLTLNYPCSCKCDCKARAVEQVKRLLGVRMRPPQQLRNDLRLLDPDADHYPIDKVIQRLEDTLIHAIICESW